MRDILDDLCRWKADGLAVALARVVDVEGSGPRDPGAAMAVSEHGQVTGSVSGGCVEGAVVSEALDVLGSGDARSVSFGYSDAEAFEVGLTCGGTVHLHIEPLSHDDLDLLTQLTSSLDDETPAALASIVSGPGRGCKLLVQVAVDDSASSPGVMGSLGDPDLDRVVARDAVGALASGGSCTRHYGRHGEARERDVSVFIECFAPPPRMIVVGAVDFTRALVRVAKVLGYRATVCDAREVFATSERFPEADEVVAEWPDRLLNRIGATLTARDAVCVLTHDIKFDVPALVAALSTEAGYIGAMGSRRTHADRSERLREAGLDDSALERVRSPIGLDLGGRSPEETAVSICAEIIALRSGRAEPLPLAETTGPIHPA